jgi:hypothetical protein
MNFIFCLLTLVLTYFSLFQKSGFLAIWIFEKGRWNEIKKKSKLCCECSSSMSEANSKKRQFRQIFRQDAQPEFPLVVKCAI